LPHTLAVTAASRSCLCLPWVRQSKHKRWLGWCSLQHGHCCTSRHLGRV